MHATNIFRKLAIVALFAALFRLGFIYLLKESINPNEFTAYIFLTSILAACSALISPIDVINSRFIKDSRFDDLYGYSLFHVTLRVSIILVASIILISFVSIPKEIADLVYIAIILGLTGSVLANFVYISNIAIGKNSIKVNIIFLLPISIKFFLLILCIVQGFSFVEIVFVCEIMQFIVCVLIVFFRLREVHTHIKKYRYVFLENISLLTKQIKIYGYQGFMMIPVSYIKTNIAPLFASSSLSADSTFYILVTQRLFDQIRTILSKPNMLLSGYSGSRVDISYVWLIPLFICIVASIYGYLNLASIALLYFLVRLIDFFIFLSCYRVFGNYLKLQSFHGYNKFIFFPELVFLSCFIFFDKTLTTFIGLLLFRSVLGFISWFIFSKKALIN